MTTVVLPEAAFWAEFMKTMAGVFAGALLGFFSNHLFDRNKRWRDNLAAACVALTVLNAQRRSMLRMRADSIAARSARLQVEPHLPKWLQMLPMAFRFSDSLTFDMKSLGFLFEAEASKFAVWLVRAERSYQDLAVHVEHFNECGYEIQDRLAASPAGNNDEVDFVEMKKVVGPALTARQTSLVDAILLRFETDPRVYEAAIAELRTTVIKVLGAKAEKQLDLAMLELE